MAFFAESHERRDPSHQVAAPTPIKWRPQFRHSTARLDRFGIDYGYMHARLDRCEIFRGQDTPLNAFDFWSSGLASKPVAFSETPRGIIIPFQVDIRPPSHILNPNALDPSTGLRLQINASTHPIPTDVN